MTQRDPERWKAVRPYLNRAIWLWLPPLAISFGLWPHLGPAYQPGVFQADIPVLLATAETILRVLVIGLAAFMPLRSAPSKGAIALYGVGLVAYLASQVAATYPASAWAESGIGFTAPAWTTLAWMLGIVMLIGQTAGSAIRRWPIVLYVTSTVAFWALHVGHAILVYVRL